MIPRPVFWVTVPEALGKGIASNFKLGYSVVLIGSHCGESGFLKHKSLKVLFCIFLAVLPGVHIHHMKPGLVSVHGVQDDMAIVVQQIVCQFQFVKGDDLLHPLGAFGWGVRVVVYPPWGGRVSFACYQPRGAVEGVPVTFVVHRYEIHQQHIIGHRIHPEDLHLEGGKHPPSSFGDDHLGAQLVELIPQSLHLQLDGDVGHLGVLLDRSLAGAGSRGGGGRAAGGRGFGFGTRVAGGRTEAVGVLGGGARLIVGFMLAVGVPRRRGEVVAPRSVQAAQAVGCESCNIAKVRELGEPGAGDGRNHPKRSTEIGGQRKDKTKGGAESSWGIH